MVCKECGHQNGEGARYCCGCGRKLGENPGQKRKTVNKYMIVCLVCVAALIIGFFAVYGTGAADGTGEEICSAAERTGEQQGHQWMAATCTYPQTCRQCGETVGAKLDHVWQNATCTIPKRCIVCGKTEGSALGHSWMEASDTSPKTCTACGATEGTALRREPVYINEFGITGGLYGRIWTRSTREINYGFEFTNEDAPECWSYFDYGVWGHTPGTVRDNCGNVYTYGIHIDGGESEDYYFGFYLGGEYTTFSGTVACPEESNAISSYVYNESTAYTKYFEVYGDDILLYTSPVMRYDYPPQKFELDVTGVEILKIVYPATNGPNEIATIYDGQVS